jgi:hypothetical protein
MRGRSEHRQVLAMGLTMQFEKSLGENLFLRIRQFFLRRLPLVD